MAGHQLQRHPWRALRRAWEAVHPARVEARDRVEAHARVELRAPAARRVQVAHHALEVRPVQEARLVLGAPPAQAVPPAQVHHGQAAPRDQGHRGLVERPGPVAPLAFRGRRGSAVYGGRSLVRLFVFVYNFKMYFHPPQFTSLRTSSRAWSRRGGCGLPVPRLLAPTPTRPPFWLPGRRRRP